MQKSHSGAITIVNNNIILNWWEEIR